LTVILPLLSAPPLTTNLVLVMVQDRGSTAVPVTMSALFEFWIVSEMPVRQPEAASTISETFARTV
jgi:hypothetical protein